MPATGSQSAPSIPLKASRHGSSLVVVPGKDPLWLSITGNDVVFFPGSRPSLLVECRCGIRKRLSGRQPETRLEPGRPRDASASAALPKDNHVSAGLNDVFEMTT